MRGMFPPGLRCLLGLDGMCGCDGGLERCPGLGDALAAGLTGGVVEAPGGGNLEEGQLTCHASDSTHGV